MNIIIAGRLREAADQLDAHLTVAECADPNLLRLPEAMRGWADELTRAQGSAP